MPRKKIPEKKKNPPEGLEPPTSRASVRHQHHCAITDLKKVSPRIEGCRFGKKVKKATQGRDRSIRFSKPGGGSVGFPKKKKHLIFCFVQYSNTKYSTTEEEKKKV